MTSAIGSTSPRSDGAAVRPRRTATWCAPAVHRRMSDGAAVRPRRTATWCAPAVHRRMSVGSTRPSGDIGERQVCGAPPCPSHDRPNRSSLRRHRGARPGVPSIKHHHRPVRQWQAIYSFDARFRNSREARRRLAARRRLRTSTQLPQPASPLVKADRVGARFCACTPCPATSSGSGRPSSMAAAVRASAGAIWMP